MHISWHISNFLYIINIIKDDNKDTRMIIWFSWLFFCYIGLYTSFNLTFKSCRSKLGGVLSTWQSEKFGSIFFISSFWTMLHYSNPRDFSINFTQSSNLGQSLISHLKQCVLPPNETHQLFQFSIIRTHHGVKLVPQIVNVWLLFDTLRKPSPRSCI